MRRQQGGPKESAECAEDTRDDERGENLAGHGTKAQRTEPVAVHEADGDDDAQDITDGGFEKERGLGGSSKGQTARKGNDDGGRSRANDCAEHEGEARVESEQPLSGEADGDHGEDEIDEREGKGGAYCAAQDIEIEAEASFEQDDDQSDGGEDGADRAKVFRADEVEDGSEDNADDGEQQNVGNARTAEDAGEGVRAKDERADDQDVCGDMH